VGLGAIVVVVLAVFGLRWTFRWQEETDRKDRWERQAADVKAGKTTHILWPEPLYLEEFVRDQPAVAAKITSMEFCIGKVSDERFGYVKQFPHLEEIDFYEVWEGADLFLARIAGMESIERLSFCKTPLCENGVRAVASFPNLKRLHIDYHWKEADLKPLRGHKGVETVVLDGVHPKREWAETMASLPNLRELDLEEDEPLSEADFLNLQKALPKVKIQRGK
jgi:hypothetical protein